MIALGTKLGPYEIVSALGAGGMGEVYRARDTRLGRDVAIKVLPAHLSSNPDLKARLEREARAISALSHPHICHLYDIGSQDGTDYLVMELVEGETLASRLQRGALALPETLRVGAEISEALAVAHAAGIVHRDLKPGNVMLTKAGAKLMDFGLAKGLAVPAAASASGVKASSAPPSFTAAPTMSGPSPASPLTAAGTIVGTIQYMSPEQIEGKEADARSDIFALGAMLYEMSTGKRAFGGKSQISVASAILESEPQPISVTMPLVSPAFENLVTACLRKNPEERFQNAHDVKLELEWIAADRPAADNRLPSKRERMVWVAAVMAAVIVGAIAMFVYRSQPKAQQVRTVINPPDKATLNLNGDAAGPPVLSPDGTMIVFTATGEDGRRGLWVRPMNSLEAHPLADTENAIFPFWSPDSRSIGFFSEGKLKTIDASGGSSLIVCDAQLGRGGAWGRDGTILFSPAPSAPILRVSANGGTPQEITKVDATQHTSHRWPYFLPDGKHYLYVAIHHDASKAANNELYYASVDGKENRPLFHAQSNAIYAAGYLLFARGDQLVAQRFDADNGNVSGEPQVVANGVMNDSSTWHVDASAANNGLLVFGTGQSADLQLVWMDRATKEVSTLAGKFSNLQFARISPRGDRIALQIDTGANDIWILDVARGVRTRLTFGPVANIFPVWSPDGQWIAYGASRNGRFALYRKRSDGSGAEELLLQGDTQQLEPNSWSSDGKYLIYTKRAGGGLITIGNGPGQIWVLPLTGDRQPKMLVQQGSGAKLSPDDRWLAYMSAESGLLQVYVVPFGGGQGKWQISSNAGVMPHWSSDGRELLYADPGYNIYAVEVKESGGTIQFGAPRIVVNNWSAPQFFFNLSPDGKKILLDRVSQQVSQYVSVVTNWTEELKK